MVPFGHQGQATNLLSYLQSISSHDLISQTANETRHDSQQDILRHFWINNALDRLPAGPDTAGKNCQEHTQTRKVLNSIISVGIMWCGFPFGNRKSKP